MVRLVVSNVGGDDNTFCAKETSGRQRKQLANSPRCVFVVIVRGCRARAGYLGFGGFCRLK